MPALANNLDVRWHLGRLLSHEEPLREFADWFTDASWSIELAGSDEDAALVARIENRLGGYSSGYISEAELLTDLREDAVEFGVQLSTEPTSVNEAPSAGPPSFDSPATVRGNQIAGELSGIKLGIEAA